MPAGPGPASQGLNQPSPGAARLVAGGEVRRRAAGRGRRPRRFAPGGSTSSWGRPRPRSRRPARRVLRDSLRSSSLDVTHLPLGGSRFPNTYETRTTFVSSQIGQSSRSRRLTAVGGRSEQLGMGVADVQPGEPALAELAHDGVAGQAVVDLAAHGRGERGAPHRLRPETHRSEGTAAKRSVTSSPGRPRRRTRDLWVASSTPTAFTWCTLHPDISTRYIGRTYPRSNREGVLARVGHPRPAEGDRSCTATNSRSAWPRRSGSGSRRLVRLAVPRPRPPRARPAPSRRSKPHQSGAAIPMTGSLGGELAAFRAHGSRPSPRPRGKKVYGITDRGEALFDGAARRREPARATTTGRSTCGWRSPVICPPTPGSACSNGAGPTCSSAWPARAAPSAPAGPRRRLHAAA